MNQVFLIGRLTRDPELKFTPGNGNAVSTFSIAVDRDYKDKDGKRAADFINIVAWRKLAEIVANNLSKGSAVAVSGSIQTRKYQAKDGTNRYVTEIVADEVKFLDYKKDNGNTDTGFTPIDNSGESDLFQTEDNEIPF